MEKCDLQKLSKQPLLLNSARVRRTYSGGRILEEWQGRAEAADGNMPEEWIASVVEARNPGFEVVENEGLSTVGTGTTLKEIIESNPSLFLGDLHYKKYQKNTGVLVKLIDSLERLTIQVHPDKKFAKEVFSSEFGKTEAWYILGTRDDSGEEPYLLLGFKPGVTREIWQDLFEKQDIPAMSDCLHKIKPEPGEVYLIEGGVPHAIGPGCFLVEIQEPTDYTLRTERVTPAGMRISDVLIHQGAGFKRLMDCFHYEGLSLGQTLDRWRIKPDICRSGKTAVEKVIIDDRYTKCFGMNEIEITGRYELQTEEVFSILLVVDGSGTVGWEDGEQLVRKSDGLFLPAGTGRIFLHNTGERPMRILRCFPPE